MSKAKDNAGVCVLVIEDEDPMRRFLHKLLEEAGYSVIEAKTAVGALEQSRSAAPDLILMDYVLPDMTGLRLLEAIRSQTPLTHVPIICLTRLTSRFRLICSQSSGKEPVHGVPKR
jgi:CheY-like chemotaxis protein